MQIGLTYGVIGVVLGVLLGVMLTISAYAWARGREHRRAMRAARKYARSLRRAQEPDPWAAYQVRGSAGASCPPAARAAGAGGIGDFMQGERSRPTYNPNPGPRDW